MLKVKIDPEMLHGRIIQWLDEPITRPDGKMNQWRNDPMNR